MRTVVRDAAALMRERHFRRLFLAYAISVFGDLLVPVALAFAVLDVGGSATDLGLVLGARVLPLALLVLVGGVWADRLPRHHVIVASHLVRGSSQALLGILLVAGVADVWQIAALQVVHGAATAFSRPAGTGLVADVVPPERLQQANALLFLTLSVGGVAGPAAAGVVVVTVGSGWAILADAATFVVAALLVAGMRVPVPVHQSRRSFVAELAAGWREVSRRRWLWVSIADFSLFQLVSLSAFLVLGPVIAEKALGGAGSWALIAAAFAAGTAVGNVLALRIEPERPLRAAFALVLLTIPSLVLLAEQAPAPVVAASELVGGAAVGYAGALWETTLQRQIPRDRLARVSAYDWMGSTALRPLGFVLVGFIAAAFGTEATLLGAAVLSGASTLAVLSVGSVRDLRSRAPQERAPATAAAYAREM